MIFQMADFLDNIPVVPCIVLAKNNKYFLL